MTDEDVIYYESHVTIEPLFDEDYLAYVTLVAPQFGFRVADLLMKKRAEDKPERSKYDTFLTGRGKDLGNLHTRMKALVERLTNDGYKVWRYKIEAVIIDERMK